MTTDTKMGIVFDQTSTTEFLVMLEQRLADEQLLFSYVELRRNNGERIIARITNVFKENPLLSKDQAGAAAGKNLAQLGFDFSRRFTYGWATCTVVGSLNGSHSLDMNRRVIVPNEDVFAPSEATLRQLFFSSKPSSIPIGEIETVGDGGKIVAVPVTLDADQMVTKHFCIFGMTGSGKTNTAAKVLEELMARGQRMIVFDSHDDYLNLENLSSLFNDLDAQNNPVVLNPDHPGFMDAVDSLFQHLSQGIPKLPQTHLFRRQGFDLRAWVAQKLLQTASVVYGNQPTRELVRQNAQIVTRSLLEAVWKQADIRSLISTPRVKSYQAYPQLRNYGSRFTDFTIQLISAIQGESFTPAQWRSLRSLIQKQGNGVIYIQNILNDIRNQISRRQQQSTTQSGRDSTLEVLQQRFESLEALYRAEANNQTISFLDFEEFFNEVTIRGTSSENVYRLSLAHVSSSVRKAMVYGVVQYFFRKFKDGEARARTSVVSAANAFPVLFILEEARSLIPKSAGFEDVDVSAGLARYAMREVAYEGRKFGLGFGLISQKPASVDQEVVSQSNTFILHQLKSPDDQQYVRTVTDSMSADELEMVKSLGTGRAIVAGVAVKSSVLIRVHSRYSEEGIPEPRPIADSLRTIDDLRAELGIEMQ
jgi:DNA helicase HerA-like ATPase